MDIVKHPNRFLWTFGNHEPASMYRRIGRPSTGGVDGGALWLDDWHHWYDSEECAETMANLGLNVLHCRYYKGMGWEYEKEDYKRVLPFVRACRKRGIKVLAYVQYGSLYPEIMKREIPDLENWAALDYNGDKHRYLDSYWRWMPCPNRPGFLEYLDGVLKRLIESKEFDGVLFDNMFAFACYCPECRKKFAERLAEKDFDFLYPEYVTLPDFKNIANFTGGELRDPVAREFLKFQHDTINEAFAHLRKTIKALDPDFLISGNTPMVVRHEGITLFTHSPMRQSANLDIVLDQTGHMPGVEGKDCVISHVPQMKYARAMHAPSVPLTDSDGGGEAVKGSRYIAGLFESLFGGSVPVDRIIMKPMRGGKLNQAVIADRKNIIARLREIGEKYEKFLDLPFYEPAGLLLSEDSVMLSHRSSNAFLRCQESLLRGHVPFRLVPCRENWIDKSILEECDTLILPEARCLSDEVVNALREFKGKLVFAGSFNGDYDQNYRQRAENPFTGASNVEYVDITEHVIEPAGWIRRIHFLADDWGTRFASKIRFALHATVHPVVKTAAGKAAAVFFTSVIDQDGGTVEIPADMRFKDYEFVTIDGTLPAEFDGDKIKLPPFKGMLMLCAKDAF